VSSSAQHNKFTHRPALLGECLTALDLRPGSIVVDGTVGGGGHAEAILERTAPDGRLIGLDLDGEAIRESTRRLESFGQRATLIQESFRNLAAVMADSEISRVDAVLLDLGVSSHQLDTSERGFRFGEDTSDSTLLDMRMDQRSGVTAADLLRLASPEELEKWFRDYADLRGARKLARSIVEMRRSSPLRTAADLRAVIAAARIGKGRRHDPATLVFQALRIAVNDELHALEDGLEAAIEALRAEGRLVVLSYHSGEDRIAKNRMRDAVRGCLCPPRTPVCICGKEPRLRLINRRPISASEEEIRMNPRARSAKLRCAARLAESA
jgi:16S rRNA (cytosine1402-N4)-methyltransferase